MIKDLTFKEVYKFVKKEDDSKLLERADAMLAAVMILSSAGISVFSSLPVTPILTLLTTKNELVKIGKYLYQQITKKKDSNSLDRFKRMQTAFLLICYTAFFEALDDLLDDYPSVKKQFKFNLKEKLKIIDESSNGTEKDTNDYYQVIDSSSLSIHDGQIFLPNPSKSFSETIKQLTSIYLEFTKGFKRLIDFEQLYEYEHNPILFSKKVKTKKDSQLPFDFNSQSELKSFVKEIENLSAKAAENFEAQYFDLSSKYDEFYVWANLQEHRRTQENLSEFVESFTSFVNNTRTNIDVGLNQLSKAIESVPKLIEKHRAEKIFLSLKKYYDNEIDKPVIRDEDHIVEEGKPTLKFPKKSEIFIPQSFKVIYASNHKQVSLEDKKTWENTKSRNDLGAFLVNYLSSPYSYSAPLIILGHPGSGKSLLTQMLAARISLPDFSPIRVELRNVNADNDIDSQIEEQIQRDTGKNINLADYSEHFQEFPPLVMLDGYDELLQASGKVFSNYLTKAQKLQEREYINERPLRIIVTSRITLIDKATIPPGATIVRLEEFDQVRRNKWIEVWNNANNTFLQEAKVNPFSLLNANKNILSLAEQPLLLLMLALYDSDGNKLLKETDIKQTELYYNLIYRFIEREKLKDENSRQIQASPADLKPDIERDVDRLGVVALGMFNRRNLHILTDQLDRDLAFFNLQKQAVDTSGRGLKQSDFVLGSFFFVHKSKSEFKGNVSETQTESAFEFLHNTFGEFLTADFILNSLISEVEFLFLSSSIDALNEQARSNPIGLSKPPRWFAGLIYTPLFSRPVVLEMMREWIHQKLRTKKISSEDFVKELDYLINKQIRLLLDTDIISNAIKENCKDFCSTMPFLGHLAIYSLNLVILRTVLSNKNFVFEPTSNDDGTNSWEQLTHIWRAWFSLEKLNELTAIFTTHNENGNIVLKSKKKFETESSDGGFDVIQNVSLTLADNTLSSLAGLFSEPHQFRDAARILGNIEDFLLPTIMRERFIHDFPHREQIADYFFRYIDTDIDRLLHSPELKFRLRAYEAIGVINNLIFQGEKPRNTEDIDLGFNEKLFHYYLRLIEKINLEEMFRFYPDIFSHLISYLFDLPHLYKKEFKRSGHDLAKKIQRTLGLRIFHRFLQTAALENFLVFLMENNLLKNYSTNGYLFSKTPHLYIEDYMVYNDYQFRDERKYYLHEEVFQRLIFPEDKIRSERRRIDRHQRGLSGRFIHTYLRATYKMDNESAYFYLLQRGSEFYMNGIAFCRDSILLPSNIVDLTFVISNKFGSSRDANIFFQSYLKFVDEQLNSAKKHKSEGDPILQSNLSDVISL